MKQYLTVIYCFFYLLLSGQENSIKEYQIKNDIEGYIYSKTDSFNKNPSIQNLRYFKELSSNIWRKPSTTNEKIARLHSFIQYAYHLKQFRQLSESVLVYEKAFYYYNSEQLRTYNILDYCLLPMANNYTRLGAFERAETILKTAETTAISSNNPRKLVSIYNNLSIIYQSQGAYEKSKKLLEKTLKLPHISKAQQAKTWSNLALVTVRLNNISLAVKYAEKSVFLTPNNTAFSQKLASIKARYSEQTNQFPSAVIHYKKAIQLASKTYGKQSRELVKSTINLANFYLKQQQLDKAKILYEHCLEINQQLSVDHTQKISQERLGDIAMQKGKLAQAISYYKKGGKVIEALKETLVSDASKIRLMTEYSVLSEKIIALYFELFQSTKDQDYAFEALNIAEKSKASIVTEQLKSQSVKNRQKSMPLFKEEAQLTLQKSQLLQQRMLEEKKHEHAAISQLKIINNELNILSNKLQLLQNKIKDSYPELRVSTGEITKKHLEDLLINESQLLLNYFVGSRSVYVFSFAKNASLTFRKIENKLKFQEQLQTFYSLFSDTAGAKLKNNIQNYKLQAHALYQQLLGPEFDKNRFSSLVIIPDAAIGLIPFDALLTTKRNSSNFADLPYLLHSASITYSLSFPILSLLKPANKYNSLIGFFPVFDTKNSSLSSLPNTLIEAENIEKSMGGNILLRAEASKENFIRQQGYKHILHVATHASSGTHQLPPSVEFADNTLYVSELYGMQFNAPLIVLSACETSVGPIYKGEGILSLARGFLYAGIQNSVVSQWKVNDKATQQLMTHFYQGLKNTQQVSESLHTSKQAYLKNKKVHPLKKSPYYWAGFSYYGQLETPIKSNGIYGILSIFLTILFLTYYYYPRKH